MLLLNKFLVFVLFSFGLFAISPKEAPLFEPSLTARELALSRASHSDEYFNNISRNPSAITNTKGVSIHASQFLGVDYSSIIFVNNYKGVDFGFQYTGSSLNTIMRSSLNEDKTKITELNDIIPYGYYGINYAFAKKICMFKLGLGLKLNTLVLDNRTINTEEGSFGVGLDLFQVFKLGAFIQNIRLNKDVSHAFQKKHMIFLTSLNYYLSPLTTLFVSIMEDKNEFPNRATFHYSIEHYINRFLGFRFGLDHNRITAGTGLSLDSFSIDIGWAESRSDIIDDQWLFSFSYTLE